MRLEDVPGISVGGQLRALRGLLLGFRQPVTDASRRRWCAV